jgi:superfamily II DNA or RNA helicase
LETVKIDYKNKAGIIQCSSSLLRLIRERFSIINPIYQQRRWNPRKYAITPSGAFQVGMWNQISQYINSINIPLKVDVTADFEKVYKPTIPIKDPQPIDGFTYYDYQEHSIREFLLNGRGISILPTAAGKGLVIAGLCKTLLHYKPDAKILIVVPNTLLLNQLFESVDVEFGVGNISRWGDKNLPDWSQNIIIANSQILLSDISATLTKVQNYDYVIVDEVHRLGEKNNKINKIIHNIHTPHKFGLTGTLPDNMIAAWNIVGKIGPILYEKSSYEIREQGTIAELEIRVLNCLHDTVPDPVDPSDVRPNAKYEKELLFLIENEKRNEMVKKIVQKLNNNVLIMVDRIIHGEILEKLLTGINQKVYFVQGSTESDARTEIRKLMEKHDDVVCIGMSNIFSTGLSIKNLHYVIFLTLGKSNVKVLQSIGRSLRKNANKNKAVIFDLSDNLQYSHDHMKKRVKMYKKEKINFTIKNIKL